MRPHRRDRHAHHATRGGEGRARDDDVVRTAIDHLDENANLASSTYEIHRAIYQQTEARAVIHAHPSRPSPFDVRDELVPRTRTGCSICAPRSRSWHLRRCSAGTWWPTRWRSPAHGERGHPEMARHVRQGRGPCRGVPSDARRGIHERPPDTDRPAAAALGEPDPLPTEMAEVIGGVPGRNLKRMS